MIHAPRHYDSLRGRNFKLTERELAGMQDMYKQSVEKALARKSQFEIVASAEHADFVICGALLNIEPLAPKDDLKSRDIGAKYISQGAGRASISIEILQGSEIVAEIEDSRDAGFDWGINDRFNNKQDVKRMFTGWGNQVVKELGKI